MSRLFARQLLPTGDVLFSGVCTVKNESYAVTVPSDQIKAWDAGTVAQRAMPQLSPDQREFVISGTTPAEWERVFGGEA